MGLVFFKLFYVEIHAFKRVERFFIVLARDHYTADKGIRRKIRCFTDFYFVVEKALVVVIYGVAQNIVSGQ